MFTIKNVTSVLKCQLIRKSPCMCKQLNSLHSTYICNTDCNMVIASEHRHSTCNYSDPSDSNVANKNE